MSVNKVILVGNVGKNPEIRTMPNGNEVASFSLATSNAWRDKQTGEKKERTEWHNVAIFSQGLVGIIKKYVTKGTKLYIEGELRTRKWITKQGIEKYVTEIVLNGYNCTLQILKTAKDKVMSTQENSSLVDKTTEMFDGATIDIGF